MNDTMNKHLPIDVKLHLHVFCWINEKIALTKIMRTYSANPLKLKWISV